MIYVILGQTASGKTKLATDICRKFNLPLINADAYQCYKRMNIGTSKPTKDELDCLEYYFIDDREIDNPIDVKEYQEKGRNIIERLIREGKDIVISGGTSLYIRALLFPFEFPNIEKEIIDTYSKYSLEELVNILKNEDEETYKIVDLNNYPRVLNAVFLLKSGYSRAKLIKKNDNCPIYPCLFFNIFIDKELGNEKIDKRVDEMVNEGLVQEVLSIVNDYDTGLSSLKAIGYQEFVSLIDENKKISENNINLAIENIKLHTRQYAKRQRTFIRTQFNDCITLTKEQIVERITIDQQIKYRTKTLLGNNTINVIENKKVLICGVGGVGSLIPSMLVRLGVKKITLIDNDVVNLDNLNRQMMYDLNDINKLKVEVLKEKLININPNIKVNVIPKFIDSDFEFDLLEKIDYIFDCIDSVEGKFAIYKFSTDSNIPIIISGGLGKKLDSTKVVVVNSKQSNDPLINALKKYILKNNLNEYDFEKIKVVTSKEAKIKCGNKNLIGSIVTVPNCGAFAMVSQFIKDVIKEANYEKDFKETQN